MVDIVGLQLQEDGPEVGPLGLVIGLPVVRDVLQEVLVLDGLGPDLRHRQLWPDRHDDVANFSLGEVPLPIVQDLLKVQEGAGVLRGQVDVL